MQYLVRMERTLFSKNISSDFAGSATPDFESINRPIMEKMVVNIRDLENNGFAIGNCGLLHMALVARLGLRDWFGLRSGNWSEALRISVSGAHPS